MPRRRPRCWCALSAASAVCPCLPVRCKPVGQQPSGWKTQACAIAIIGGADGPTSIYVSAKLAPELMAVIAVAAYSY
ncbi:MAG: sodium ion-translocating decarboxylase subunit beta, partial [Ottowia sp.]|nr:sodium ion-translocating decarboxylase subunit beta [Ottowia sp.]